MLNLVQVQMETVSPQAEPHRFQRHDFSRVDVAQVGVGAYKRKEIELLVLLRRFPKDLLGRDPCKDLLNQPFPHFAGIPVDADVARLTGLCHDIGRSCIQLSLHEFDPLIGWGDMLPVLVLRADLAKDSAIFSQLFNIAAFFVVSDIDRTVRHFNMRDLIFFKQFEIVAELAADHKGFEQETAEKDRDTGVPEQIDLLAKTAGEQRGTKRQLDQVDMRAGARHQMGCLHDAQPFIVHHRQAVRPGTGCPLRDLVQLEIHARNLGSRALKTKWLRKPKLILNLHVNTCYMAQMDTKTAEKISKALSDPTRLKILSEIKKKHDWLYCVDLYDNINLAQPSICHHLKQLTETAIILPEKEGRNIKYTMNNEVIDDFIGFLQGLKK